MLSIYNIFLFTYIHAFDAVVLVPEMASSLVKTDVAH